MSTQRIAEAELEHILQFVLDHESQKTRKGCAVVMY